MSLFSYKKCTLATSPKFGRYVKAEEDIRAGELLLTELPFVCGPYWNTKINCLNCYAASDSVCKKCGMVPLCWCCIECHEPNECRTLQKLCLPKSFLIDNLDVTTPLRFLLLLYQCTEQMTVENVDNDLRSRIDEVLSMESHCDERRGTWIWNEHSKNVIKPIRNIAKLDEIFKSVKSHWEITDEFLQKICGILDVNTFEVRTENFEEFPVRGLYAQAALLAHDCIGNTFITLDDNKQLKVFASVDIKAGDIVYNNYTATLYGTEARQEHLTRGKYFECECRRCSDPIELGTHLSSLRCRSCSVGFLVQMGRKSNWKCLNCNMCIENENIHEFLCEIRHQIHQIGTDVERMELFITKYTEILHPNHYLLIEMKQNLAAIIRHICSTMNDNNSRGNRLEQFLKRKMELCKEFIPLLDILQPGISRLKAVALYEYFVPLVQLAKLNHRKKLITDEEHLGILAEGESIAKKAIGMLIYEPATNPEGMLAKQAMRELKELRMKKAQIEKTIKKTNGKALK